MLLVRFEVFTTIAKNNTILWDVTPWSVIDAKRRFRAQAANLSCSVRLLLDS